MRRHIALFRWKAETTSEHISGVEAALRQLPAKIPCIQSYRFGRDLGVSELIRPISERRDAIQTVIEPPQ